MRKTLCIAAGAALLTAGPAPAGPRPCRDKSGRIVSCPQPRKTPTRCKDAQGRFTACPKPDGAAPAAEAPAADPERRR